MPLTGTSRVHWQIKSAGVELSAPSRVGAEETPPPIPEWNRTQRGQRAPPRDPERQDVEPPGDKASPPRNQHLDRTLHKRALPTELEPQCPPFLELCLLSFHNDQHFFPNSIDCSTSK